MANEIMIEVDGLPVPCPSTYTFGLQDVSAAESGRTEDTKMHKNRVGQKRKIGLSWLAKDWQETAQIMQAFNPEYITVRYPDMLSGKYEARQFYVGDRSAPVKLWWSNKKLIESISFDIIEV